MNRSYCAQRYRDSVKRHAPKSDLLRQLLRAFWTGGLICTLGEALFTLYRSLALPEETVGTLVSVTLIFLTALLTGLGAFDRIGAYAGAGTFVPITGFANAIAAPSMEYRPEGFVLGVGAKMFVVAGPVIVYGVSASVLYGLIYWITTLF